MPANFAEISYSTLNARKSRVENFFADLDSQLASISAPTTYHQEIYWDGGFVRRISDDEKIQFLSLFQKFKYYNQGLGLMKLAMNNQLYPA